MSQIQKCPKCQRGGGATLIGTLSQIFSLFYFDASPNQEHDLDYTMWSKDPEENPPFHNFYKVFVPYCSSDVYTGTRNASEETGNYYFHGKFIVEALMEDMLASPPLSSPPTSLGKGGSGGV